VLFDISSLKRLQVAQGAVVGVEAEVEHAKASLFAGADECVEVGLPADVEGHVAGCTAHLELHVVTSDLWCFRQVEADVAEGESERNLLVLDGACPKQGEALSSHRHGHVHGSDTLVTRRHDAGFSCL